VRSAAAFVATVLGLAAAACAAQDAGYPPPTPLPAQPSCAVSSEPAPLCVLVLGDSTAAGVPLTGSARWWERLDRRLVAALPDRQVEVDSWAVPSSRIDVLESAATTQAGLDSYDVAIILEGVNDVGHTGTDEWASRYERAVEALESRGLRVILTTPIPNFEAGAIQTRHDAIDDAVRRLERPDRPVLDVAARFRAAGRDAATYYSDNLHQSVAGQAVIAEMAERAVTGLLGET
jgi:lysophospholipase L1-like esterase